MVINGMKDNKTGYRIDKRLSQHLRLWPLHLKNLDLCLLLKIQTLWENGAYNPAWPLLDMVNLLLLSPGRRPCRPLHICRLCHRFSSNREILLPSHVANPQVQKTKIDGGSCVFSRQNQEKCIVI